MWQWKTTIYLAIAQAALIGPVGDGMARGAVEALVYSEKTVYDPAPQEAAQLIYFSSPEGQELLLTSQYRDNFWSLAENFVTQEIATYCAVATTVMTLNALNIERPSISRFSSFSLFTQQEFFTPQVRAIRSPESVQFSGMTMEEVSQVFRIYGVESQVMYAEGLTEDQVREIIKKAMKTPRAVLIANYYRQGMGQKGVGHFSPIGAYHENTDRVLLMDVARYKYPPVWVPLKNFYKSIRSIDRETGRSRGLVLAKVPRPL